MPKQNLNLKRAGFQLKTLFNNNSSCTNSVKLEQTEQLWCNVNDGEKNDPEIKIRFEGKI